MVSSRLFIGLVTSLVVTASFAVVPPKVDPLRQKEFRHSELQYRNVFRPVSELPAGTQQQLGSELIRLGVDPANAYFDLRTGRWGTLVLVESMIPGSGVRNDLQWSSLGYEAAPRGEALEQAIWDRFRGYLIEHAAELRIDPQELGEPTVTVIGERLVYIHVGRQIGGVPVRDTFVKAALNSGNLVLWGERNWGPVEVSTAPRLASGDAEAVVQAHVEGFPIASLREEPHLELIPTSSQPEEAATFLGAGLDFRLAWVLRPEFESDLGSWEALVDAQNGELLSFVDTNHHASRRVEGGIFPVSNDGDGEDGTLQFGFPMPFADIMLDGSPVGFTTTGGNVPTGSDPGTITTALSGQFARMNDNCGTVDESAAAGDLDLEGVPLPGTDCQVPPGHSAGDTNASRSGFYELNRLIEQARGYLPDNNWLDQQLTANMNINLNCNAFWNGSTVNFYTSGGGCANTGEIAAIFDHEWGHGMDDNDGVPNISRPGEGIADIFAQNRLNESCIGRNFRPGAQCGGYGDPCIDCTGVRDTDWAKRQSGEPHDIDFILSNCTGSGNTPCGRGTHCEGSTVSESAWDLVHRDLMAFEGSPFDLDLNTALELGTRLSYYGSSNVFNWYQCVADGTGGCNADSGYLGYLTADDDNGDLTDGTPHMSAIFAAFDRHQIACPTPTVQNSGCAGGPTAAPTNLAVDTFDEGMQLTWDPVADASEYRIFRTEGVNGCDFGKALVGTTTDTTFSETGLRNGFEVLYSVVAVGANDACTSLMSECLPVIPTAGPSGFIEGTVIDADTLEPIEGAAVDAVGPVTVGDETDADGTYSILAPVGTYDVTADHEDYDPETVTGVAVTEGGTEVVDFELTLTPVPIADISPDSFTFEVPAGGSDSDTLNMGNIGSLDLVWSIVEDDVPAPLAQPVMLEEWSDDFDSYATGSQIHGQGGWKGWFNDPAAGALVSDAQAQSTPNSVEIVGASDLVHEYVDSTSGQWVYTAWQFIPADFTGASYFIMLNSYDDSGSGLNWSTQVQFVAASNTVLNDGASGGTLPLIRDQWVEIRVEIDLDADTQDFFYNDELLYSGTWTNENSGGGALNIGAVDLFANGASAVYYDDLSLVDNTVPPTCVDPNDVPWLSVNPDSGVTPPGDSIPVDVTADTTGLDPGEHTAFLCVTTNDPDAELVVIPVDLTVLDGDVPVIEVAPESFSFAVPEGGSDAEDLAISNVGGGTLTWDIEMAEPAGSVIATWRAAQKATAGAATASFASGAGHVFPETGNLLTLGDTQMSQTTDTNIVPANSVACPTGPNHLMRRFYFDEHPDVGNPATISSVDIAIQEGVASQTLTVNLYTLASDTPVDTIPVGSLTEIGTGSVTISPSDDGTIVNVPVTGTVSDTVAFDLVVEATVANVFFIGATDTGETHPGFVTAPACGITVPTRIDSIGPDFEDTHIIMVVNAGGGGGPSGCNNPTTIPWLSVDPSSGSTGGGETDLASVMVDAGDLDAGDYEALLCVNSNDPGAPLVEVPVSLTVEGGGGGPVADITPDAFSFEVPQGSSDSDTLNVGNIGGEDLTWSLDEAALIVVPEGAPYRYGLAGAQELHSPVGHDRASGISRSRGEAPADRVVLPAPQAQAVGDFTEGFDDITTLPGAGWAMINNSDPVGPSSWFQGNETIFPSHEGAPNAYIAANFESTDDVGDISNWLLTPEVTIVNGTTACFWTRTSEQFEEFFDRLEVRMSIAGDSTDVGDTAESVGDFTDLLLSINPDLLPGEYPEEWTEFCVTVRERSREPVTGRFAFRYWVTDSGPNGSNGDYIGIDTVSVTQPDDVPPPGDCDNPVDIPWLSATPEAGVTAPNEIETSDITVDASDLETGEHTALLCVSTNDPNAPLVEVPVSVTVTEPGGQAWVWQHPLPQGNDLTDVVFLDSTTGIAIGWGGVILRTTDGGQSWSLVDMSNVLTAYGPYYFHHLSKVDANTIWAAGHFDAGADDFDTYGIIVKTTDGGLTWSTNFTIGPGSAFLEIQFVDATRGIAVGYDSVNFADVFRTTDGGNTWIPSFSGGNGVPWDVCFTDSNLGYMVNVAGEIQKTTDGGATWTLQYSGTSWFKACFFADANNGTVVGSQGTILNTTDGGETWVSQSSPATNDLFDVYFTDDDNGWITTDGVGNSQPAPGPGHILHTSDGGASWTVQHTLPPTLGFNGFDGVYFTDANTGWAVADRGVILKTSDGGGTWTETAGSRVTLGGFGRISSVDENTAIAIGNDFGVGHAVVKTADGGSNWTLLPNPGLEANRDVSFVDADTGWIVGSVPNGSAILKTTDGGNTWTQQLFLPTVLLGIYFLDADTGWVCGAGGRILRTTDGGTTWIEESAGTATWLYVITFLDANTGWAGGRPATAGANEILKTADGGKTWVSQGVFASSINDISVVDSNIAWAVGGGPGGTALHNGIMLKTTNGGASWTEQEYGSSMRLSGVKFTDADHGVAVGFGLVISSVDGGDTWVRETIPVGISVNDIASVGAEEFMLVGSGSSIVRMTLGSSSTARPAPTSMGTPAAESAHAHTAMHMPMPGVRTMGADGYGVLGMRRNEANFFGRARGSSEVKSSHNAWPPNIPADSHVVGFGSSAASFLLGDPDAVFVRDVQGPQEGVIMQVDTSEGSKDVAGAGGVRADEQREIGRYWMTDSASRRLERSLPGRPHGVGDAAGRHSAARDHSGGRWRGSDGSFRGVSRNPPS